MNEETQYLRKTRQQLKEIHKKYASNPLQSTVTVETTKKINAGKNLGNGTALDRTVAAKLDDHADTYRVAKVGYSFCKSLQQARVAAGLTQQALAQKIAEPATVIQTYENGTGIPKQNVISKLNRLLKTKLRLPPKPKLEGSD